MANDSKPKYKTLYREFVFFSRGRTLTNGTTVETIEGNNKSTLRHTIAAKTTPDTSFMLATFNTDGECVDGGIVSKNRRMATVWVAEYRQTIAERFFADVLNKDNTNVKHKSTRNGKQKKQ